MAAAPPELEDIRGARVLAMFGDMLTTDHISPAGNIKASAPAGIFLAQRKVDAKDEHHREDGRIHHHHETQQQQNPSERADARPAQVQDGDG